MKVKILFGGIYSELAKSDKYDIEISDNIINTEKLLHIIKEKFNIDIKNDVVGGNAIILINGRNIKTAGEVKINDGDFISIIPPIKGG
ncbi:MAG: MoaD/ThiS family protein [Caldisphaera sp.]|jgi:molybdopterin converting factor small subunit